jgi:hypothetical protein
MNLGRVNYFDALKDSRSPSSNLIRIINHGGGITTNYFKLKDKSQDEGIADDHHK